MLSSLERSAEVVELPSKETARAASRDHLPSKVNGLPPLSHSEQSGDGRRVNSKIKKYCGASFSPLSRILVQVPLCRLPHGAEV